MSTQTIKPQISMQIVRLNCKSRADFKRKDYYITYNIKIQELAADKFAQARRPTTTDDLRLFAGDLKCKNKHKS